MLDRAANRRRLDEEVREPVTINDGVWIGAQATINPGVTIGDHTVVATDAVVTDDVPENALVAGDPATIVTEIDEETVGRSGGA